MMLHPTEPTAYNDYDKGDSKQSDYIRTRGNEEAV